ncbi:C-type lectin-like [Phoenicopterus ruber ruber]
MSAGPKLPPRLLGCLLLLAFLGGALASPPSPTQERTQSRSCPGNWLLHRGHCYGYFVERKTWDEAEDECKRYGPMGHLASMHSDGTSRILARFVARQRDSTHVWIGLRDEEHTRRWKWSDQSPFDFKRWAWGQPNNLWNREDCTVLDKFSGFSRWHDYDCNCKFPFICKHRL